MRIRTIHWQRLGHFKFSTIVEYRGEAALYFQVYDKSWLEQLNGTNDNYYNVKIKMYRSGHSCGRGKSNMAAG